MQNPSPDAAVTPPDAPTVMYFIYQVDGDGATSYEVQNGSVATFWFGHRFTLDGTTYYTGFSWDTREHYGKPGEQQPAGPDDRANLAEATFVLAGGDAKKPWKFRGQEWTIGALGAYDKADDVDTRRKPIEHRTADGRLLLAVPTSSFDRGISSSGYALLLFNPKRSEDDLDSKVWRYVGSVRTGEDNSAACDDGNVMPCTDSDGELAFVADGNGLPQLIVTFKGTTIEAPGKTRALGAGDTVHYRFDSKAQQYITP
ncbi:hypothetical protein [Stenotrophomonas muris]|jgi:hypothetical protein|uniref:hypothetical protein n=1 Tax=Stenotrophomonas muris TaxID=2963283 RepID=UPI0013DD7FB2|nr:hypothetical protein [Stenotrophomonas maltophilia]